MSGALAEASKKLGADDVWVKAMLKGRSPLQAATQLIDGTKLDDPEVRRSLMEGGLAAVTASTDPLMTAARRVNPITLEQAKWFDTHVESVMKEAGERLGKARLAVYGDSIYPDATFTLRLSYGQVKGLPINKTLAPYKTTFYGLYDRAASFDDARPFALPARYTAGKNKLDLSTPLDFVTTNDTVGGNSGPRSGWRTN